MMRRLATGILALGILGWAALAGAVGEPGDSASGIFIDDGIQIVSFITSQNDEAEIAAYFKDGVPRLPLQAVCRALNIPVKEAQGQYVLTVGPGKEVRIDSGGAKATLAEGETRAIDLFRYGNDLYVTMEGFAAITGVELAWLPESMAVRADDERLKIARGSAQQQGPAGEVKPFLPVATVDTKLSYNYLDTENRGVRSSFDQAELGLKTEGTVRGGKLVSDFYFTRREADENDFHLADLYWEYQSQKRQWIVGTADLFVPDSVSYLEEMSQYYPTLTGYDGRIAGFSLSNRPEVPELLDGRPLAGGESFYGANLGSIREESGNERDGLLGALLYRYGVNDRMNLGGHLISLNDHAFAHRIYEMETQLAPFDRQEISAAIAYSSYEDGAIAEQSDRSWRWGHHWRSGPFESFLDGYSYGKEYYPLNGAPVDMRGEHLGFKYAPSSRSRVLVSFQHFIEHSLTDVDAPRLTDQKYKETRSLSLYGQHRFSERLTGDSSLAFFNRKHYDGALLEDDPADEVDIYLKLNQRFNRNYAVDYFTRYYQTDQDEAADFEKREVGVGFNYYWDSASLSLIPSLYRTRDRFGESGAFGAELYLAKDWFEHRFRLSLRNEYYQKNDGDRRRELSHHLDLNYQLSNQYQLSLGSTWSRTEGLNGAAGNEVLTNRWLYLCLRGSFGVASGTPVLGIGPDELGEYGAIVVTVFDDVNQNGIVDRDEKTLPNIWVSLDGSNYQKTDWRGQVIYKLVRPGLHQVDFNLYNLDLKYSPTTSSQTIDVLPNMIYRIKLGLAEVGSISGRVFIDADRNGRFSGGDQPLENVKVLLDGARTAISAADGSYYFADVPAGSHRVMLENVPEGMNAADLIVEVKSGAELTDRDLTVGAR